MPVGDNIKKYRELRGLTVEQLADKMDIGKSGIYNWEKNETDPSLESLTKLSKALDCRIIDLIEENHTHGENEPAVTGKPLGEPWEAGAFRKIVEGSAEYVLVHKAAFENHRFTSLEQISANAKELADARGEIQRLVREFIEYVKDTRGLGNLPNLPKIEEAKKDTSV